MQEILGILKEQKIVNDIGLIIIEYSKILMRDDIVNKKRNIVENPNIRVEIFDPTIIWEDIGSIMDLSEDGVSDIQEYIIKNDRVYIRDSCGIIRVFSRDGIVFRTDNENCYMGMVVTDKNIILATNEFIQILDYNGILIKSKNIDQINIKGMVIGNNYLFLLDSSDKIIILDINGEYISEEKLEIGMNCSENIEIYMNRLYVNYNENCLCYKFWY